MKLVFLDSCILIAAAIGEHENHQEAIKILQNPEYEFASSIFVKLETLPHAIRDQKFDEAEFYESFFDDIDVWAEPNDKLFKIAFDELCNYHLQNIDALHVAATSTVGADALITLEKKKQKSILQSKRINFVTIKTTI